MLHQHTCIMCIYDYICVCFDIYISNFTLYFWCGTGCITEVDTTLQVQVGTSLNEQCECFMWSTCYYGCSPQHPIEKGWVRGCQASFSCNDAVLNLYFSREGACHKGTLDRMILLFEGGGTIKTMVTLPDVFCRLRVFFLVVTNPGIIRLYGLPTTWW